MGCFMNCSPDRVSILQSRSIRYEEVSTTCQGHITNKGQREVCRALEAQPFAHASQAICTVCAVFSEHSCF